MNSKYRSDIGTLRAIAVLAVVFYHFKVPFFDGGYVGVDIFFVLSGYLMSALYLGKISSGSKGILSFYSSRLKRLYPALISCCILSAIFIYVTSPPFLLNDFIKELKYALTFTSNYFYQNNSGYFDEVSEKRWLLHTWSLSVEFQFYLIFPAIVIISNKLIGRDNIKYAYYALFALSLILCICLANIFQKPTFYTLSTRMWELLAGAILSIKSFNASKLTRTIMSCSGIVITLLTICLYKESSSWPDFSTILPIAGAALCIIACNATNYRFIQSAFIKFIADISYSFYLWHWIAVAYMHNQSIPFDAYNISLGLAASAFMAIISKYFIEDFGKLWVYKIAFSIIVLASVAIPVSNAITHSYGKIEKYADYGGSVELATQFHAQCFIQGDNFDIQKYEESGCLSIDPKKKTIVLLGDSHAAQLSQQFRQSFTNYNVLQITATGCFPNPNNPIQNACSALMRYFYNEFLPSHQVDYIIVAAYWISYGGDNLESHLNDTFKSLEKYSSNVYAIGEMKSFGEPLFKIALKEKAKDVCNYQRSDARAFNFQVMDMIEKLGAKYINVFDFDQNGETCNIVQDDVPLFFDTNHLTPKGAKIITDIVKQEIFL